MPPLSIYANDTMSLWKDTVDMPTFSPLNEDVDCDVCVIGAGIAGLTTAYLLAKKNKKVCVLEHLEIGAGQTGQTTAHFTYALDERYHDLEKKFGASETQLIAQSHKAALKKVEEIVNDERISCDFEKVNGYLFCSPEHTLDIIANEVHAAHKAGLMEAHTLVRAPLDAFDTGPCLNFPNQLQLHPLKYLKGLAECILAKGGKIFTHSHVIEVHGGENAYARTLSGRKIKAKSIVVATNTPVNNIFAVHTKQSAYRSYVLGYKIPKGRVTKGLYWDTGNPYHYIRSQTHDEFHDILIIGGEDHKTGQKKNPQMCFQRLQGWSEKHFKFATEIAYRWSGQVMESVDSLAFLGHNPMDKENIYVITGHSGNGMSNCTLGAMIIADQIFQQKNPWEDLYSPSRINVSSIAEFIKENANVAAQYRDWVTPAARNKIVDLADGEGIVINKGLKKIAVHREGNSYELLSAVCPHLKGVVRWNSIEKSWDCPCHGSRFDRHGQVIEGPAIDDLQFFGLGELEEEIPTHQERAL